MFKNFFERICNKVNQIRRKFRIGITKFARVQEKIKCPYKNDKLKIFPANLQCTIRRFCRKKGTAVLEAALCVPVLLYLVFFTIEAIRIGVYQIAIDNMALKLAFEYGALKSSTNFDAVVNAAKPAFFKSMNNIHCRICVYPDLGTLVGSSSAGVGNIMDDPPWSTSLVSIRYPSNSISETTTGSAVVVTVSYPFPFSSPFIKKLFAGGKNYGDKFLLWGRAVNVCN